MGLLKPYVGYGDRDGETHLIPNGRSITVINPAQAAAAFSAAAATGRPVTLLSAPDAAASVGAAWFMALIDNAASRFPDVRYTPVLDCGDAPGHALTALRLGLPAICFEGPAVERLQDIAGQIDSVVLTTRPESLNLSDIEASPATIEAACRDWLCGSE